ncbi:unnamed protein product, partial [Choristocarpus tenellus]
TQREARARERLHASCALTVQRVWRGRAWGAQCPGKHYPKVVGIHGFGTQFEVWSSPHCLSNVELYTLRLWPGLVRGSGVGRSGRLGTRRCMT